MRSAARPSARRRRSLLGGFALHRSSEARDFLLGIVAREAEPLAMAAITALRLYVHDEGCQVCLRKILGERGAEALLQEGERVLREAP